MKRQMKFGIELEVATKKSKGAILRKLNEAGVKSVSASYGEAVNYEAWKVHRDGSLATGWEIVSPPLYSTEELKIVTNVLRKEVKVRCTNKCGLHIHHDISDLTLEQIKNIYKLYAKYEENAIKSIQSPTRHDNQYCESITPRVNRILQSETIDEFKNAIRSRYHTINSNSYVKFGTIEFRGAQGTVEIDRIESWLELTHKIIETAVNMTEDKPLRSTNNEEALEEMFEELNISESTIKHYKKVQRYFKKIAM